MRKKILVLGAGNMIRGDDGIGILAARRIKKELKNFRVNTVEVRELEDAHINVLDILEICDKLIVVDAVTKEGPEGLIERVVLSGSHAQKIAYSSHQMGLSRILDMARGLHLKIPKEIIVVSVVIRSAEFFTSVLSPEIKEALPQLVALVKKEIGLQG